MTISANSESWEELYRYWLSRHIDGHMPGRADIDPMIDLPQLASSLIVIALNDGQLEYRLVGSDVVRHFGMDCTGRPVGTSNVDPVQLEAWRDAVETVFHGGKPVMLVSYYPGAEKPQTIAILLPLAPAADGARKLLGATFFGRPFPRQDAFPDLSVTKVLLPL